MQGYVRMLYKGSPVAVPACQTIGKHHPESKIMCTYDAFMGRVRAMSLDTAEYDAVCKTDQVVRPDWD